MGLCIFCGAGGPMTREHVIPQWMHPSLPKFSQSFQRDVRAIADHAGVQQSETNYIRIGRPITASQPPIACGKCNSRWMRDLQGDVQESMTAMILGKQVSPADQFWERLVPWLAMTTMTGEFIDRRYVVVQQHEREALYEHCVRGAMLDLPGWGFGISSYLGGELGNPIYRHYRQRLTYDAVSQTTTFRFGELVLSAHSGMHQLPGLTELLGTSDYSQIMAPLGIPGVAPVWPPKVPMNDLNAESVTRRALHAVQRGLAEGRAGFREAGLESARWVSENAGTTPPQRPVRRKQARGKS